MGLKTSSDRCCRAAIRAGSANRSEDIIAKGCEGGATVGAGAIARQHPAHGLLEVGGVGVQVAEQVLGLRGPAACDPVTIVRACLERDEND